VLSSFKKVKAGDLDTNTKEPFSAIPQADSDFDETIPHQAERDELVSEADFESDCEYRSPDCSDEEEEVQEDLKYLLAHWAVKNNVSQSAVSDLLAVLKTHECFSDYPVDSRTLLKTPRQTAIKQVSPGQYCHFGLVEGISSALVNCELSNRTTLSLQFNVDGLPISKSSGKQFWPILCNINTFNPQPFPVGIYYGEKNPNNVGEYLETFIDELHDAVSNGIIYNGEKLGIKIQAFICDTPARAFIKSTKCHGGYAVKSVTFLVNIIKIG
jgi:hypothetical protein